MSSNPNPNEVKSMNNSELAPANYRNWSELPADVTLMILMKLGSVEILESVQFVCKMWYILCKESSIWQTIHICNLGYPDRDIKHEKMLFNAIDRSDGRLIDLDIEGFGSDELCSYFASRSCQLKRLRLARCENISANAMVEALEKLSSLEELELTGWSFQDKKVATAIKSCPLLTTFKFNKLSSISSYDPCDEVALAIAENMPEMCRLQLTRSNMTNVGLTAILDACPHLRSLKLNSCFNLNLREENLWKRVSEQIKDLEYLPYKYTEDYGEVYTDDYSDYYEYESDDEIAYYSSSS